MSSKPKCHVLSTEATADVKLVYHFSEEEYRKGMAGITNGKDAAIDDVLVKQINNLVLVKQINNLVLVKQINNLGPT